MKAFIITLQESELACRIAEETNKAAESFNIDASLYPATLGYNSKPLFDDYGIKYFLNYTIINKPGHQGCFLSHFRLWLKCIEINEPIMILEHDGIMIRPLPDDICNNFDDVLRLDAFSAWKPNYYNLVSESLKNKIEYHKPPTECSFYSSGNYYVGAYGYLIKPAGASKLVEFARNRGVVCTEAHIGTNIVDIVSTTASIVKLHPHYDNIGLRDSSTNDLSIIKKGRNSLTSSSYLPPSKYKQLFTDSIRS